MFVPGCSLHLTSWTHPSCHPGSPSHRLAHTPTISEARKAPCGERRAASARVPAERSPYAVPPPHCRLTDCCAFCPAAERAHCFPGGSSGAVGGTVRVVVRQVDRLVLFPTRGLAWPGLPGGTGPGHRRLLTELVASRLAWLHKESPSPQASRSLGMPRHPFPAAVLSSESREQPEALPP